jgi:hypothetical protein
MTSRKPDRRVSRASPSRRVAAVLMVVAVAASGVASETGSQAADPSLAGRMPDLGQCTALENAFAVRDGDRRDAARLLRECDADCLDGIATRIRETKGNGCPIVRFSTSLSDDAFLKALQSCKRSGADTRALLAGVNGALGRDGSANNTIVRKRANGFRNRVTCCAGVLGPGTVAALSPAEVARTGSEFDAGHKR